MKSAILLHHYNYCTTTAESSEDLFHEDGETKLMMMIISSCDVGKHVEHSSTQLTAVKFLTHSVSQY